KYSLSSWFEQDMLNRVRSLLPVAFIVSALVCLAATGALAQSSTSELQRILSEKAAFEPADFAALQQGQTIVKLTPITDKREIAASGVVSLRTSADQFLWSYLDSMTRQNNQTVLEAGRFGSAPAVEDLQHLTVESDDIDDLKQCITGDCQIKLSANMIERFKREVDWEAADYAAQATRLLKTMLADYVRDYVNHGPAALIEYNDKRDVIRVADEQQALGAASGYLNDLLRNTQRDTESGMQLVQDAIIWSKVKFGLKPVLIINHVKAYKFENASGPQVLVASNQIYANHYFTSSLALAAFVNVPGATSYLVYENRSRTDALFGPFSKIKRGVIEKKSIAGLKSILEHSKSRLEGSAASSTETVIAAQYSDSWGRRLFGGIRPLLWVLVISAFAALLLLRRTETIRVPVKETRITTRGKL
ncbi:MAG TPA: hypothetical protein VFY51_11075, partial [Pyrinomonadaceae bacterium]|nr:hypothetical protein [Pyrinomonadaceae bacterium]